MIKSIDHIVLTASDTDKTIQFYCDVLGMTLDRFMPADGSPERLALSFGTQKINLHQASSPYVPMPKTLSVARWIYVFSVMSQ